MAGGGYERMMWMNYAPDPVGKRLGWGRRITVPEWGTSVLFKHGAIVDGLGAGAHRRFQRGLTTRFVDLRPWVLQVPMQEVPTSDALTVKISAAVEVRIVDARAWLAAVQEPVEIVYLRVQVAIRDVVGGLPLQDLLEHRTDVATRIHAAIGALDEIGLAVARLDLKDVVLPGELKRAHAAVALAKAEGEAALERARGETAALRALANAARLATETPALVDLRLLQELGRTTGHTIVLGQRSLP